MDFLIPPPTSPPTLLQGWIGPSYYSLTWLTAIISYSLEFDVMVCLLEFRESRSRSHLHPSVQFSPEIQQELNKCPLFIPSRRCNPGGAEVGSIPPPASRGQAMTSFLAELAPREQESPGARRFEASMDPQAAGRGLGHLWFVTCPGPKTSPTTCEDGRPLKML